MTFKFRLQAQEVTDFIDGTINRLRSIGSVLKIVLDREVKAAQKRIRTTKVDPNGRPWQPWAPSTQKGRKRDGTLSRGLLFRSGRLLESFESKIANKSLSIWNTADYAGYLQNGTPKMPARPFLGWSAKSKKDVAEIVAAHFANSKGK